MAGHPVLPEGSPPSLAPYSPGFRSGQFVCTAGMLALDSSGPGRGGRRQEQTRQVLENIKEIIEAAAGTLEDIVYNMIFLADLGDYQAMNEVYGSYFPENPPAARLHSGRSRQARIPGRDRGHRGRRQLAAAGRRPPPAAAPGPLESGTEASAEAGRRRTSSWPPLAMGRPRPVVP